MYEWRSHTGEAELRIVGDTAEQIFVDAIDAFSRYVELDREGEQARREVNVQAGDRGALLVELLGELIFLADTEGFVSDRASVTLEDDSLRVVLEGRLTRVSALVKAATYHGLQFEQNGQVWDARIVLDV